MNLHLWKRWTSFMFHVSTGTSLPDKRRRLPKRNPLKLLLVLLMDASSPSWSFCMPEQQRATQTASEPRQDPPPSFSRQSQGARFNNNSKRVLLYFFSPFIVLSVFAGQQGGMCPGSLFGRWSRNTPTNKKALQASPHLYVHKNKIHRESRNAAASDVKMLIYLTTQ